MKNILVIGADGFVGASFVEEIDKDSNYRIVRGIHKITDDRNTFYIDLCDRHSIEDAISISKPDYVINLAGINSIPISNDYPEKAIEINVIGTEKLLESIKEKSPNTKVLLIGSSEVYDYSVKPLTENDKLNPRNVYGMTKLWQEQLACWYMKKHSMKIVCTRSFNHIGAKQSEAAMAASFCRQAAEIKLGIKSPVIYTGNLDIKRDILDVRDVITAYLKLLTSDNACGIYNVCSGKTVNLQDFLKIVIALTGMEIEVRQDPSRIRSIDNPIILGSNEKIKKELGWERKYTLEQTIKDIFEAKLLEVTNEKN